MRETEGDGNRRPWQSTAWEHAAVHPDLMAPPVGALVDAFGRVARDLRVSITDRCDLRCTYCMPAEGLDWMARSDTLTAEEIERLVGIFAEAGIRSLRVTGGEPLVRADVVDVVRRLAQFDLDDLSLTTNGTRLTRMAGPLAQAGLRRVNVSLDSLDADRYALITRRDALAKVLAGIDAATAAGLTPLKVNCVAVRNINDDEIVDFAAYARRTGCDVRFIEPMPLDGDRHWRMDQVVPGAEIVERIDAVFPLERLGRSGVEPSVTYRFGDGSPGKIGVIASVTEPFCSTCDRLRITADGQLRTCLFAENETDLRSPMRDGADDETLTEIIATAVRGKQAGHDISNVNFLQPTRTMSAIGG